MPGCRGEGNPEGAARADGVSAVARRSVELIDRSAGAQRPSGGSDGVPGTTRKKGRPIRLLLWASAESLRDPELRRQHPWQPKLAVRSNWTISRTGFCT